MEHQTPSCGPGRTGCPYCMVTLDPADGTEFVTCAGPACGRPYHRPCWDRGAGCARAGCAYPHAEPVLLPPPAPLPVAVECHHPVIGAPNNTPADLPLGISCGAVLDTHEQVLEVRNNSAEAVLLPLVLGPLWAPLLPDPTGWYDPATGVLAPGEVVRLRAAFARVRPPFARRRVPLCKDQEVELRSNTEPQWSALAVGGVCLLLVVHAALVIRAAAFGGSPWWAAAVLGAAAGVTVYLSPSGLIGVLADISAGARRALAGVYENVTSSDTRAQWRPMLAVPAGVLAVLLSRLPVGLIVYCLGGLADIESGALLFFATSVAFLVYATLALALWSPWVNEYGVDLVPLVRKAVRAVAARLWALGRGAARVVSKGDGSSARPAKS